jgi:hypothetical protein
MAGSRHSTVSAVGGARQVADALIIRSIISTPAGEL